MKEPAYEAVIRMILDGDEKGIEELNSIYGPLMRYIVTPVLNDEGDIEECLSEVAMKVWESAGSFDKDKGSFTTWLTTITRNTALNILRTKSRRPDTEAVDENTPFNGPSPEEDFVRREQRAELIRSINRLPDKERNIIYRKYYYMQSTRQIAREMRMSERAVEGRLYRARLKLKEWMGGEMDEER